MTTLTQSTTAQQLYSILDAYRKNPDGLRFDPAEITDQLGSLVALGEAIPCVFPACHGKVDHPDLLADHRPDLSEYLCISQLARMNDEVKAVYPPGLKVFMVHEGQFYVDCGLTRSDETMDDYLQGVRRLTDTHPFILSLAIDDFFPESPTPAHARQIFRERYCPAVIDPDEHRDMIDHYAQRIRRLFSDGDHLGRYGTYRTFEEFVDAKANEQLAIWIGFRRMLADHFGDPSRYIRFSSVYKPPQVTDQIALNYVPNHHREMPSFYSVWRRADGSFSYVTHADAAARGLEVSEVKGYRFFGSDPTQQILRVLERYRKNPFNEQFDASGVEDKIRQRVLLGGRLDFMFPGFHGKIDNPDFVFGPSVDLGDKVGLETLQDLLGEIGDVYEPGAHLNIMHEGHYYVGRSPLIGSQDAADTYLADFRKLVGDAPNISSYSAYELLDRGHTLDEKLDYFFAEYCPTRDEVAEHLADPHYCALYTTYKQVNEIHQERLREFRQEESKRARRRRVKELATIQMQIYLGFAALIKTQFAGLDYIRLSSLYKSPRFTDLVAVNYLPGQHHMSTPAFHCLVKFAGGGYDFMKKKDALLRNYQVADEDGLKYFVAQ